MPSTLASQLAQSASLNSALLKRGPVDSYLFTGKEAAAHDLDTIHALAHNSFLALDPNLSQFEEQLFSNSARTTDRTLLNNADAAELDSAIKQFLVRLGPWLLEQSAGRVVEWLVRRFRIQEFNVESVLALFLPYHESPHFAKMITILQIPPNSVWTPLLPHAQSRTTLQRPALVRYMQQYPDIARFVVRLLPNGLKGQYVHRTLVAFNAAVLHDFLREATLSQEALAYLLPALLEPLQKSHLTTESTIIKEAVLGSFILLATLSHRCSPSVSRISLTPEAVEAIVAAMTSAARRSRVSTRHYLSAVIAVLEPQPQISISQATVKQMLKLEKIAEELTEASKLLGFDHLLVPMLPTLMERLGHTTSIMIIQGIIDSPIAPQTLIGQVASLLLSKLLVHVEPMQEAIPVEELHKARTLLSTMHQRHPDILDLAIANIQTDDNKEALGQLIIAFSIPVDPTENGSAALDSVIASSDTNATIRESGVNALIASLPSEDTVIHSALLARLHDTSVDVLAALYTPSVVPVFAATTKEYISALSGALSCQAKFKLKRPALKLHLDFLLTHLWSTFNPAEQDEAYWRIVFPFLLFSKPRHHSATLVLELISTTLPDYELFNGCTVLWATLKGSEMDADSMMRINNELTLVIAKSILQSSRSATLIQSLLESLQPGSDQHTHVLALLVIKRLFEILGDSRDILLSTAHEVLDRFSPALVPEDSDLSDDAVGAAVVAKPSSQRTTLLTQLAILRVLATTPPAEGDQVNWLVDTTVQRSEYVRLLRRVFILTRSPTVLQSLLVALGSDALAFFTGVWIQSQANTEARVTEATISLHHALALLQAHSQDAVKGSKGIDFQTILPSLVIALRNPHPQIRKLATQCIAVLSEMCSRQKFVEVYMFDIVYGNASDIQYISQEDLVQYLSSLVENAEHFVQDGAFLDVFHGDHLGPGNGKKDYRRHTLCYLLSHGALHPSRNAQIAILRSLDGVSDSAKARILLPAIWAQLKLSPEKKDEAFEEVLFAAFDVSIIKELAKENDGGLWEVLKEVTAYVLQSVTKAWFTMLNNLTTVILPALKADRKSELSTLILTVGASDTGLQQRCGNILQSVLLSSSGDVNMSLLSTLLQSVQLDITTTTNVERASKRSRVADMSEKQRTTSPLARVSVLAQTIIALPEAPTVKISSGALDLISRLLETLSQIVQGQSQLVSADTGTTDADINYVEQVIMAAVERVAQGIQEQPALPANALRLDILVDLIRSTSNPQTLTQCLLLISALARLSPTSVLGHVMPIFTFMGSNADVWQRDDVAGWGVVRKTVDSIVPVMASSLKGLDHPAGSLDLYLASRDFLRVFSDASTHIPRHRRTSFFTHLTDVLGPTDFLVPICLLLIQRSTNRVAKQGVLSTDIQSSLALPLSLLHHYPIELQSSVLCQLIDEVQRLTTRIIDPGTLVPAFLDESTFEEHAPSAPTIFKRRALAILTFVGFAIRPSRPAGTPAALGISDEGHTSTLIARLIQLASLEAQARDISDAANQTIQKVLKATSATVFVTASLVMLQSDHDKVKLGALSLLASRIPLISGHIRAELSGSIIKVAETIQNVIKSQLQSTVDTLSGAGFKAVAAVAGTMQSGEESVLTNTVPLIMTAVREKKSVAEGLDALSQLPIKLGPRLLPFFHDIVSQLVNVLQEKTPETEAKTFAAAALRGLLIAIPTFWSPAALKQALQLSVSGSSAASNLPKIIAKRIPAKTLLPAVVELWETVEKVPHVEKYSMYFDLLSKSLRNAPRPEVDENQRMLYQVFVSAFDRLSLGGDDDDITQAKTKTILAFVELVSKLNEISFRPLLRRFYDWAFASSGVNVSHMDLERKKNMFCDVYLGLMNTFKGLMNPYLSFLSQAFIDILTSFSNSSSKDMKLWSTTVQILSQSFKNDDGVYWSDDKLRFALPQIQAQVPVCARLSSGDPAARALLRECFTNLVECAGDEMLVKAINLELLMHTRSEEASVRLLALSCAESLWQIHGGKLLGFASETTTFIAECNEDENDKVVRESFKLKDAVESVAGNIDGL